MSDNTLVENNATDADNDQVENQAQEVKTYTQQEVDNMMARMKGSLQKKLLKPYEELGDVDELRTLKAEAEERRRDQQLKRGEFEKTLQELASKKDAEIARRDEIIREYKINTPLLSAAAEFKAVAPEQVKSLLARQVRLNDEGEVEVVDSQGTTRYKDDGKAFDVADLVREFLDSNPHFKAAAPSTTNTKSNVSAQGNARIDISKLDMKNPEHRKVYAEYRRQNGIA